MSWLEWLGIRRQNVDTVSPSELAALPPPPPPRPAPPPRPPRQRVTVGDATINPWTGLGDPEVDKTMQARPTARDLLTPDELTWLHRFDGIARRITDLPAADGTRKLWSVDVDDEPEDPLAQEWRDLGVRQRMKRGWGLSRQFGGCVVFMVTGDMGAQHRMAEPLDLGAPVVNLVTFDRHEAQAWEWNDDITSRHYRRPERWVLTPTGSHAGGMVVHASRVLYIPGNPVPPHLAMDYDGYDDSILEACFRSLANHDQTSRAAAVIASEMKQSIMKLHDMGALAMKDPRALKMRMEAIQRSRGVMGMMVLDGGDDMVHMDGTVQGFAALSQAGKENVAAEAGMPATLIWGDAPSGLTTDNEAGDRNYRQMVADGQTDKLEPVLTRLAEVCFASRGDAIPAFEVSFNPLSEPTDAQQAELEKAHAETDEIRIRSQVILPHEARSRWTDTGYQTQITLDDEADEADPLGGFEEAEAARLQLVGE